MVDPIVNASPGACVCTINVAFPDPSSASGSIQDTGDVPDPSSMVVRISDGQFIMVGALVSSANKNNLNTLVRLNLHNLFSNSFDKTLKVIVQNFAQVV